MNHFIKQEKYEWKKISDVNSIVDAVKHEVLNVPEVIPISPRIPDLSTGDKKKILELVDMLAKLSQEKETFSEQLTNYCNAEKTYEAEMVQIKEMHQSEKNCLLQQIEELKETLQKNDETKELELTELTVTKTKKEMELQKLHYEHSQQIENLQRDLQNRLDNQKNLYETEINQLRNKIFNNEIVIRTQTIDYCEKDNASKLMIEVLQKEKEDLESKVINCKGKLKSAFHAIKKIKKKLERKPTCCSREVQTDNLKEKTPVEERKKSTEINQENEFNLNKVIPEQALISELFFTQGKKLYDDLDPMFFSPHVKMISSDIRKPGELLFSL